MAMAGGYYQRAATTTAHAFVIIVIIIIYQGDDDDGGVRNLFSLTSWDRQTKNIQKKTSNSSQAECGEPERFEIVLKTNINPVMCEIYFQELTRAASAFICHYFSSNSSGYNRTLWLLFIKVSGKDGRFIKKYIHKSCSHAILCIKFRFKYFQAKPREKSAHDTSGNTSKAVNYFSPPRKATRNKESIQLELKYVAFAFSNL